jgi:hypothetical protein
MEASGGSGPWCRLLQRRAQRHVPKLVVRHVVTALFGSRAEA